MVKKVDLLDPFQEKQQTVYEIIGELSEKTNEVIDHMNLLDTTAVATTLAGYGITDAYTKTQVDTALVGKADDADLATKADINHTHPFSAITDKPITYPPDAHTHEFTAITGKPATYPPDVHTHAWPDVTGKPTTFPPNVHTHAWPDVTGKPATFPPDVHTHAWPDVTGKPATFPPDVHTHAWPDITGKPATFPPPLMSGSVIGGAQVGNGLGMSGNYLYLKALRGTKIDSTDNAVVVDRAVTDAWYVAKAALALTNITAFSNGFTHLAGRELKYSVTGEKMLWLNGIVDGAAATSSATGTVIATLPAGITPQVAARCVVGLSGDLQGMIDVNPDLTIKIVASLTGVSTFKGWISINVMVPLA